MNVTPAEEEKCQCASCKAGHKNGHNVFRPIKITTPAHEWREEFEKRFVRDDVGHIYELQIASEIVDFIQKTLDTHTAHLVEREREKFKRIRETTLRILIEHREEWEKYLKEESDSLDQHSARLVESAYEDGVKQTIAQFLRMNIENPKAPVNIDEVKRRALTERH